ncbi:hypothetical protein JTB14_009457 [Gonioctena quinquepunctata]|nr:hypothetical protein JTB14_009457 [Gonioctena quinquepunctata]
MRHVPKAIKEFPHHRNEITDQATPLQTSEKRADERACGPGVGSEHKSDDEQLRERIAREMRNRQLTVGQEPVKKSHGLGACVLPIAKYLDGFRGPHKRVKIPTCDVGKLCKKFYVFLFIIDSELKIIQNYKRILQKYT